MFPRKSVDLGLLAKLDVADPRSSRSQFLESDSGPSVNHVGLDPDQTVELEFDLLLHCASEVIV